MMKFGGRTGGQRPRRPMQQNLRRARKAMKKMVQHATDEVREEGDMTSTGRSFKRSRQEMPRKKKRKEARRIKKARKHAFLSGKKLDETEEVTKQTKSKKLKATKKTTADQVTSSTSEKTQRREEKIKMEKDAQHKRQLLVANEEEEKNIRRLEKELKFRKKRKTKEKIIPKSFMSDGLDYLLDVVDPSKLEADSDLEEELLGLGRKRKLRDDTDSSSGGSDDDDEEEEEEKIDVKMAKRNKLQKRTEQRTASSDDYSDIEDDGDDDDDQEEEKKEEAINQSSKRTGKKRKGKSKHFVTSDVDIDVEEELDQLGGDTDSDDDNDDDDNEDSNRTQESLQTKQVPKMDPYGNIIGEKKPERTGTYVPPQRRAEMMGQTDDAVKKAKMDRLRKQLKGSINRLSEGNAQSICNQIEELYLNNSRNDMNETITSLIEDACISPALMPERLAMEHVLLIAVLHTNVGSEVGAHFLQSLATQFDGRHSDDGNYGDGKEIDNLMMLLIYLYNFRVIHCVLMYNLISRLAERFTERDIEMLLQILRSAGTTLRKDDPSSLKDIILLIQTKANECPEGLRQQSRVKFMLETISALRNNNLRKIPNYDPSHMDRLRKLHRSLIRERGHNDTDSTLRISLADLLTAEEKGRWWIVGSAWSGHGPREEVSGQSSGQPSTTPVVSMNDETSQKIVALSRQQRMNTDIRRTIFSIVMTAEDFTDAFEKLVRMGLKGGRDREIVHVTLDCCQQEKMYNPYYAYLSTKLCQFDRKFRMAFQFAIWDKFRLLEEMTASSATNLSLLLAHLVSVKALSLSILKVIEFADINKSTVRFMRTLLLDLLVEKSNDTIAAIFGGIAMVTKLRILREGLGLFLHHFLLKARKRNVTVEKGGQAGQGMEDVLRKKIAIAESAMHGEEGRVKL